MRSCYQREQAAGPALQRGGLFGVGSDRKVRFNR